MAAMGVGGAFPSRLSPSEFRLPRRSCLATVGRFS